jgi:hypothetical protein
MFDARAKQIIHNLQREFHISDISDTAYPEIQCSYSVGIEIEIKFKYLFPEIHAKYFTPVNAYHNLTDAEKAVVDAEISVAEAEILAKFRKTRDCGIPQGDDHYWEFAFTPVYDLGFS